MKQIFFGALTLVWAVSALAGQTTPVPDVAPVASGHQVVINIPQQRLFLYYNGKLKKVYPVGVGKARSQTVIGEHKIGAKAFKPTWHIPLSIQRERGDGVKSVPPGPKNPLGPVFVRLGKPSLGLGIHGTSNPRSVPGVVSHGCVRMKSPDAEEFAHTIATGSPATVSYELAALNEDSAGNLWLAVFRDPYNKRSLKINALKQSIAAWSKAHRRSISATHVDEIIKARAGKPVCLTCEVGATKISGSLFSLAWNSGSGKLTTPKQIASMRPETNPEEDWRESSEIEVDATDDNDSAKVDIPENELSSEINNFKGTSVFDDVDSSESDSSAGVPLYPVK